LHRLILSILAAGDQTENCRVADLIRIEALFIEPTTQIMSAIIDPWLIAACLQTAI